MEELESEILKDLSKEEAFKHLKFFVEEVGERLAGTPEIQKAANYIMNNLEKYGLETRIDHFPIYHSYPKSANLQVVFPETKVIAAKPACHIASTLPEGIEGELVYLNVGAYEDYEGKDVSGKIGLVDMTWDPPRPEKARIAYEKGLKALIIMNWGATDNPIIQMGAVKGQWGNPTPETFKEIPRLPVISITRAAGEYLKDLCTKGEVKVWLRAEATREWVMANQPVGVLRGNKNSEEFLLVGGHLEAWGRTAICNSSGNALTLELARVFARHKEQLKRNLIFAFWDGHEVAEAAGSTWFVDQYWDSLTRGCIAYLNIDNPGILGTSVPGFTSVTELQEFLQNAAETFWGEKGQWHRAYKGGDESFFGIGIPYISFYTRYTEEKLKELNYASLSPWLHSEADTIDKIDPSLFEKHLKFFGFLGVRLCNLSIVPYDFVAVAKELNSDLITLKNIGGKETEKELKTLIEQVEIFQELAEKLKEKVKDKESQRPLLNKVLLKISRELSPIMRSEAGRYGHDPYGYSLVGKPIPRLYVAINKLLDSDKESDDSKLWWTQFLRERNRVFDALNNSIEYAQFALTEC